MDTTNKGVVALGHALMDMTGKSYSSSWGLWETWKTPSHVNPEEAEAFLGNLAQSGILEPPGLVSRPGGSAINVAAACKDIGLSAVAVACVGNDSRGKEISDSLRLQGIPLLGGTSDRPTGVFISVYRGSNPIMPIAPLVVVSPGAARAIRGFEALDSFLTSGWLLHIDGLLVDELPWLVRIAEKARAKDIPVSIDASTVFIAKNYGDALVDFACSYCEYLFVNEQEYSKLLPHHAEKLIAGDCALVVKLGSRGARLISRHITTETGTEPLDLPLDLGAGDAFAAGFLKASLDGASPQELLRSGNTAALAYLRKLNRRG
ncbi:MAG: Carbohydrate kinase [Spirochaetes bacterium]|nr:MAG: Carbohydrate kinase [Spirochaetota bacterium]